MNATERIALPERTYTLRSFRETDYEAVSGLVVAHDHEFVGISNFTPDVLREEWTGRPNFDPTQSVVVAAAGDGTLIGMIDLRDNAPVPVRPSFWAVTLRDWPDAVAGELVDWAVARARLVERRVPSDARIVVEAGAHHHNARMAAVLRSRGFASDRSYYTMLIEFDGPPEQTRLPDGFRLMTFAEHPEIETWARAIRHGFLDHRGSSRDTPLEFFIERLKRIIESAHFDPTLYWLAVDADGTPAAVLTSFREGDEFPNTAVVRQLATLPAYRRRGLAMALLKHCFSEHHRRGRAGVSLGVDGASLTNAVALYERAGMRIAVQWDAYELELRPGIERTTQ